VSVKFANARGIRLAGAHNCTECCSSNATFEVSYDKASWQPVASSQIDGESVIITLLTNSQEAAGASTAAAPLSVRHAHQDYPECVILNDNGIPASPFVLPIAAAAAATGTAAAAAVAAAAVDISSRAKANGVALTPPMGFNSWNYYHCNIDERGILQIADTLINTGLAAKGYKYVNIDGANTYMI
jgi:hypothetical protein